MKNIGRDFFLSIMIIFGWQICTVFFVFAGYCITGAIPVTNIEMGYAGRLLMVLSTPFDAHFNEYTPIGMILGFIICELIFGVILFAVNNKRQTMDMESISEYINVEPPDEDSEKELILLDDKKNMSKGDKTIKEADDTEDEIVVLQEKAFLELFNHGYSMQQINEMMELTKYIKELDVGLLTRMFKTSMASEEIRKHIEVFYG